MTILKYKLLLVKTEPQYEIRLHKLKSILGIPQLRSQCGTLRSERTQNKAVCTIITQIKHTT